MKTTFRKIKPGSKINIWILGRKAEAVLEEYIEDSGEVTFTHKGRTVTLDVDMIDKVESTERCLHLVLQKHWYRAIEAGIKNEEYREFSGHWIKRLCDNPTFNKNGELIGRKKIDKMTLDASKALNLYNAFKEGRMIAKEFDIICFQYGYTKQKMYFKFEGLDVGFGRANIGAPVGEVTFIIKIGDRLER